MRKKLAGRRVAVLAATFTVDRLVGDASPDDDDALILPGGGADPDHLRTHQGAMSSAQAFVNSGKPVGLLCHGPLTLVNAGVVRGRTLKSSVGTAGGPHDLPAFCRQIVTEFAQP
jgi:protease I